MLLCGPIHRDYVSVFKFYGSLTNSKRVFDPPIQHWADWTNPCESVLQRDSFPFALKHERSPVIGSLPALFVQHRNLRLSESSGRPKFLTQHTEVESPH